MHSNPTQRRTRVSGERGIYWRDTPTGRRYEITYTDSSGRQRWRTIDGGLREARQARADVVSRIGRGERVVPTRETLAEAVETFLEGPAKQLRPRTQTIYGSHLRVHVLPRLGCQRVSSLTEDDVLALMAALRDRGLSSWTVHGVLSSLSRVLGHAARRGVVVQNVVRRLERGERPSPAARSERRVLTRDEIAKLLAGATPTYRPLLATGVYTGLRVSELLGLTWADVDFDAGFVRVRKQLGRDGVRVEPKTPQAVRDVVLLPALGRLLRAHKLRSPFSRPADPVFASSSGRPLYWRNVSRQGLERAVERARLNGEGKLTMHALRDTFASHLILDLGLDVVQVSRQLGHARPSITSDTYARLFDQARHSDDIRERMATSEFGGVLERQVSERERTL
jgi:integrase